MKLSDILIPILFVFSSAFGAEWDDPSLGTADPGKPVYQLDWGWFPPGNMWIGGSWSEKRIPSVDDLRERLEYEGKIKAQADHLKALAFCTKLILAGIAGFLAGMIVHAMNSLPILDRIAEYVMALGVGTVVWGILSRFFLTHEVIILWTVIIPLLVAGVTGFILSRPAVKKWSISHGIKWAVSKVPKKKKDAQKES